MKSLYSLCILVALLVGATILCVYAADSSAAGQAEVNLLVMLFTGKIGTAVGLLVAFLGAYTAIAKGQSTGGLVLIILGILITFLPSLYNGVSTVTCALAESLGGKCGGN